MFILHSGSLYRFVLYFALEAELVISAFLSTEALGRSARTRALGGQSHSCSGCCVFTNVIFIIADFYFPSCFSAPERNMIFNSTFLSSRFSRSFLSPRLFLTGYFFLFLFFFPSPLSRVSRSVSVSPSNTMLSTEQASDFRSTCS